jgi:Glu-tRNA(Gln) amidotransferase subunit E-like FAD-binding protein
LLDLADEEKESLQARYKAIGGVDASMFTQLIENLPESISDHKNFLMFEETKHNVEHYLAEHQLQDGIQDDQQGTTMTVPTTEIEQIIKEVSDEHAEVVKEQKEQVYDEILDNVEQKHLEEQIRWMSFQ